MNWSNVEKKYQTDKNKNARQQTDPQQNQFSSPLINSKRDKWHDGVRDEETKDKPEQMSVIIDPRKQTWNLNCYHS